MTDLAPTIAAKSDQMNSDDLMGGPITIRITRVSAGTKDQPININYDGDGGKPWKPCKSMRRVLVSLWSSDGASYVGRSLTLFRDPSVKWGGIEVGGIRISHMSDIPADTVMQLTETRGKKSPYTVRRLVVAPRASGGAKPIANAEPGPDIEPLLSQYANCSEEGLADLESERQLIWNDLSTADKKRLKDAADNAKARLAA